MTILSKPASVREALKASGTGDKKLPAPTLQASAAVSDGKPMTHPEGSIVVVIPREYGTKAYERFLAYPKGHAVKNPKTGETTTEYYPFGCMIDTKAAGFNSFFFGMPKSGE